MARKLNPTHARQIQAGEVAENEQTLRTLFDLYDLADARGFHGASSALKGMIDSIIAPPPPEIHGRDSID